MNLKTSGLAKDEKGRGTSLRHGLHTNLNTATKQTCFRQAILVDITRVFGHRSLSAQLGQEVYLCIIL